MSLSLVKYHGGKHYLAKKIVALFPKHEIYVEPYGGGASVLLNKPPANVEVYNDIDNDIYTLFYVLRVFPEEFIHLVNLLPYSQYEFECGGYSYSIDFMVDSAVRTFIKFRMSFGGQGKTFSCTTKRSRGGIAGDVNAWLNAVEGLPEIVARLKETQMLNMDGIKCIKKFDGKNTLIYCDPPYVKHTRISQDVYTFEMLDAQHIELAHYLNTCNSKVIISGYRSELYDDLYSHWNRVDFDMPNNSAGGKKKQRRIECVWMNYSKI